MEELHGGIDLKVGDRVILEYTMADTHYWPGTIIEILDLDHVTIELDNDPNILTTKILTVHPKHLFIRCSGL
jgi:hypothetical protein